MCAVWQVPNTVAGPGGLYSPFRSLIISPQCRQPGTRVVQKLQRGFRRQARYVTCGYETS